MNDVLAGSAVVVEIVLVVDDAIVYKAIDVVLVEDAVVASTFAVVAVAVLGGIVVVDVVGVVPWDNVVAAGTVVESADVVLVVVALPAKAVLVVGKDVFGLA